MDSNESLGQDLVIKFWRGLFKLKCMTKVSFLMFIFMMMSVAIAAEPPPVDDCGAGEEEPYMACEEKQLAAQAELLTELEELIGVVEQTQTVNMKAMTFTNAETGEESDLKEHMNSLKRRNKRAQELFSESTEEDYKEMVSQAAGKEKTKEKCEWLEIEDVQESPEEYLPPALSDPSGELGNGICDSFEAFDYRKGEEGEYVWIKERSLKLCEKVCEDREIPGQAGKLKKEKIKERHIGRRSESINTTKKLTEKIKQAQVDIVTTQAMVESFRMTWDLVQNNSPNNKPWEECDETDRTAQKVAWGVKIPVEAALLVAKIVARVAEGINEGSKIVCEQVVAGFNNKYACAGSVAWWLIAEGAADVLEAVIAGLDLTIEHGNYYNVDDTFQCIKKIRKTQKEMWEKVQENNLLVRDINKKAGDSASGIKELKRIVLENREYIKDNQNILLTPHGRRDDLIPYEAPPPPPVIVSVKGQTGSNILTVTFNEGVWTGAGQTGQLVSGDFKLTNNAPSDPETIIVVNHIAGSETATLTLNKNLDGDEFSYDTLAAYAANAIFNQYDIPMDESIKYYLGD